MMTEDKMKQVDFWIRFFRDHTSTIGCVELDRQDCQEILALLQELEDKKDKPNKMAEVAALFNKKLGEEFEAVWGDSVFTAKITEDGLEAIDYPGTCKHWDYLLVDLLTGRAVIVNE